MAQFRATIKGNRGAASRLGTASSGIVAEVNGWDRGIKVTAEHVDGEDVFMVWVTGGSNGKGTPTLLRILEG